MSLHEALRQDFQARPRSEVLSGLDQLIDLLKAQVLIVEAFRGRVAKGHGEMLSEQELESLDQPILEIEESLNGLLGA